MKLNNLHELFILHLKDLYSAENQLVTALPKMAAAATNSDLKKGFEDHLKQTENHADRLKEIAEGLNFVITGHSCKAMQGLIAEGEELIGMKGESATLDSALIAAAQKVEHYEISAYGTAVKMAELMKHNDEKDLLSKTLDEEKETDEKLSKVAKVVNQESNEM